MSNRWKDSSSELMQEWFSSVRNGGVLPLEEAIDFSDISAMADQELAAAEAAKRPAKECRARDGVLTSNLINEWFDSSRISEADKKKDDVMASPHGLFGKMPSVISEPSKYDDDIDRISHSSDVVDTKWFDEEELIETVVQRCYEYAEFAAKLEDHSDVIKMFPERELEKLSKIHLGSKSRLELAELYGDLEGLSYAVDQFVDMYVPPEATEKEIDERIIIDAAFEIIDKMIHEIMMKSRRPGVNN